MLLNVTVPVFNEGGCLVENIRKLTEFLETTFSGDYEIVIADNGSTDETLALATKLAEEVKRVHVLHLDQAGRGGALKASWNTSKARILSYMDADLSSDLTAIPSMIDALDSGRCDLAVGSRLLNPASTQRGWKRGLTSHAYVALVKAGFGVGFSDPQCGFKAIRRQAAARLLPLVEDNGWFFDTELLVLAERDGWQIKDVPVAWLERKESRVRLLPTILGDLKGIVRLRHKLQQLQLGVRVN